MLSIGNIAVGGRAKTPLAGYVAARLREMGERPAILSRGYGRRDPADGVVVVRDPGGIRADLDRAGDEPLMLARQLAGVSVLVCPDRYLAGRLAEHHFDCTVHVLDDGFQHFPLHREIDIVVVAKEDLPPEGGNYTFGDRQGPRTLPSGRLREPVDALEAADAVIQLDGAQVAWELAERTADSGPRKADSAPRKADRGPRIAESGQRIADSGRRTADSGPRLWHARRRQQAAPSTEPVVAVAGIAEPARFFSELRHAGWTIARELPYRDHYRYSARDVAGMVAAARSAGAAAIVTTEKDLVRLLPFRPFACPIACVPLILELDDAAGFDEWLRTRLAAARAAP